MSDRQRGTGRQVTTTTTIADIAELAGVSTAAVSLALNGKKGVSEKTRARVVAIAAESGYRINRLGRALRQSRTGAIGLYLPESAVHYGYYTETTLGAAERLHADDLSLLIVPTTRKSSRIESFPPVDGFILMEPHSDDLGVAAILSQDLPVVTGDPPSPDFPAPWGIVESPNDRTTREVFDRFLAEGARRPGLLLVERVSTWSRELEAAYLQWCADTRVEPRVILIDIHDSNRTFADSLGRSVAPGSGCDALLVGADGVAVRVAGILRTLGHRPGESIKLISGVDSPIMEFHTPPITAVDLQPRAFGAACAELLLELLDQPRPEKTVRRIFDATLTVRESG